MSPSLCPHHAGITPNQKSMILPGAGGDPSLETMKRHMRRILQPCGMELKQDVRVVKDDALNKQVFPPGPSVSSGPGDTPLIGDAYVASNE